MKEFMKNLAAVLWTLSACILGILGMAIGLEHAHSWSLTLSAILAAAAILDFTALMTFGYELLGAADRKEK